LLSCMQPALKAEAWPPTQPNCLRMSSVSLVISSLGTGLNTAMRCRAQTLQGPGAGLETQALLREAWPVPRWGVAAVAGQIRRTRSVGETTTRRAPVADRRPSLRAQSTQRRGSPHHWAGQLHHPDRGRGRESRALSAVEPGSAPAQQARIRRSMAPSSHNESSRASEKVQPSPCDYRPHKGDASNNEEVRRWCHILVGSS